MQINDDVLISTEQVIPQPCGCRTWLCGVQRPQKHQKPSQLELHLVKSIIEAPSTAAGAGGVVARSVKNDWEL